MAAIEEPKCSYYSQHFNDNDKNFELMLGKIDIQTSFHHFAEKKLWFSLNQKLMPVSLTKKKNNLLIYMYSPGFTITLSIFFKFVHALFCTVCDLLFITSFNVLTS